jgi:GTP-dependent dephospho-CoA kinase
MSFRFVKDLSVNDALRKELSRPFGKTMKISQVVEKVGMNEIIYAVGDVTVSALLEHGYKPKIAVFDYRTERKRVDFPIIRRTYANPLHVKNPRGVLSLKLWKAVRRASRSRIPFGIHVIGEEDLASLACIYFADKGTKVMYGLRRKGIVVITIDEKIKKYVTMVLKRMGGI